MIYRYFVICNRTKFTTAMSKHLPERLARADPRAIKLIYKGPLGKSIRKYVLKRGGDAVLAEDVLVITILRVMKLLKNEKYKEDNRIDAFIMGVAKNVFKEETKREKRKRKKVTSVDPVLLSDYQDIQNTGSLTKEMDQLFLADQLNKYLKKLSKRDRLVIDLHYLKGYKLIEIDKMLNLSKNHANVICSRAIQFLKKIIPRDKL